MSIVAHHRFCTCSPERRRHVYLGNAGISTDGEAIDHFYCQTCNSTWKELGGPLHEVEEKGWVDNIFGWFREMPRGEDLVDLYDAMRRS